MMRNIQLTTTSDGLAEFPVTHASCYRENADPASAESVPDSQDNSGDRD